MAALTWFGTSNLVSVHQECSETDPGAEVFASPVTGFVTGTVAATNYASQDAQTEVAAASFGATVQPDGTINTGAGAGDCWRATNPYNGTFDTANWTIHLCIRANTTAGGTSRGRVRIFSGNAANGSDAVERTAAVIVGSTVTPATGTTSDSTAAASVTGWTTTGDEYIFFQTGWETVTAGAMSTNDENYRVGNGSALGTRFISANFTPADTSVKTNSLMMAGSGL